MIGTPRGIQKDEEQASYSALVVNVVILSANRRILLTRREDCGLWCLPGGYVQIGESAAEAAVREVKKETCVDVSVLKLSGLYSASNRAITPPAKKYIVVACFIAEIIHGKPSPGEEVTKIGYFDKDRLPHLVPNQLTRIEDALRNHSDAIFD